MQKIIPHLWFNDNAEEAVNFYVSIFKNSKIGIVKRYDKAGSVVAGRPEGSVMTITFQIEGQEFFALNGGPLFTFTEAISFIVNCDTQEEVDTYWNKLSEGGDPASQQCGWLKDKYGVSWQITPTILGQLITDPDPVKSGKVMEAMLKMKKIDIAELKKAYDG
jgi:predicted 3-demethylubiquinone-9 3-methyltransferase (glyoxalase superfamily)